jgi:hypothetical protein
LRSFSLTRLSVSLGALIFTFITRRSRRHRKRWQKRRILINQLYVTTSSRAYNFTIYLCLSTRSCVGNLR